MKVSVIIPAFNAADTIGDTLASLVAQSHQGWEAVVVDDGSHDDTAAVATRWADRDPRIRVVRQANGGEAAARNAGLTASGFDWVFFLDADDWIAPQCLTRLTQALAADPSCAAVHCRWARVAPDGTQLVDAYRPPTGDLFEVWARRSAFPVHACIVRKSLVDDVGGFDTTLIKSADWDLWQRVARTGAHFGGVPDVLSFYRMRPGAASLEARQLLIDGLRVLRRGHAADERVRHPDPRHAAGLDPAGADAQAYYLMTWCAGLALGAGEPVGPLFDALGTPHEAKLFADAIAETLHGSVPLATCSTPSAWGTLWPRIRPGVRAFLDQLEARSGDSGLASRSESALVERIVRDSELWSMALTPLDETRAKLGTITRDLEEKAQEVAAVVAQYEARIADYEASISERLHDRQAQLAELDRRTEDYERRIADHRALERGYEERIAGYEARVAGYESRLAEAWQRIDGADGVTARASAAAAEAERSRLLGSLEHRVGDFLLHRMRLGRPVALAAGLMRRMAQSSVMMRLRVERLTTPKPRVVATICSTFPIYSQTFVHQELDALRQAGFAVRVIYSTADSKATLGGRFGELWSGRRRLVVDRSIQRRDFEHFRRRDPGGVAALIERIAIASGLSTHDVEQHDNVRQGFTFARMVEAYRPDYIHSYFFYDRSLMAFIAAQLLGIPRGVSCYADHVLADYELKVVALQVETADVVVATSARIRAELIGIAPDAAPERIIVKPNGIDATRFPVASRPEPAAGEPYRLVCVCRIEPKKGLLDLVAAVKLLRDRGVPVEAHIVGDADEWSAASRDYRAQVDARIAELNLWGVVHLEGRHGLEGVLRFHRMAHLFVAPFVETDAGDKDGIPTALLEGMSTGLAVVATDAGSITEVIEQGVNGLTVRQRDPAALAEGIATLLGNSPMREQLGAAAAATVRERFDVANCEAVLHRRLESVISGGRHG